MLNISWKKIRRKRIGNNVLFMIVVIYEIKLVQHDDVSLTMFVIYTYRGPSGIPIR